jgi:hypothetical protein
MNHIRLVSVATQNCLSTLSTNPGRRGEPIEHGEGQERSGCGGDPCPAVRRLFVGHRPSRHEPRNKKDIIELKSIDVCCAIGPLHFVEMAEDCVILYMILPLQSEYHRATLSTRGQDS